MLIGHQSSWKILYHVWWNCSHFWTSLTGLIIMHCNAIQQMNQKIVSPAYVSLGIFPRISHSPCLRCCSERTVGNSSLLKVVLVPSLPRTFSRYSRMKSSEELEKCSFLALFVLCILWIVVQLLCVLILYHECLAPHLHKSQTPIMQHSGSIRDKVVLKDAKQVRKY